jgi:sugar lactone lactonase YvrE
MVLVPAAAANGQHGGHGPRFAVVADDLNNPRQLAVHDGAVYVAEAGTGGTNCVAAQPCVGFTGSVTRVRDHNVQRVQSGLLSVASVENGQTDVTGVDAVAFRGDQLYGVATGTCMPLPPLPEPLASQVAAQLGKVLRLNGGTSVTSVGDPGNFECTTVPDPDGAGRDTNPYGLAIRGETFFVADAAGNDIVKVRNGQTSLLKVVPSADGNPINDNNQPVPTSVAWGPDGALYVGTLSFATLFGPGGGAGGAKVYRIDPNTNTISVYASGLTAVTGIAFDDHGRLYVSEWTTGVDANGPLPNGDVVVVPRGGGDKGRKVIGDQVLHFPGGVAVNDDGVYVSNWSIAGGAGPGPHGQLVRFSFDD